MQLVLLKDGLKVDAIKSKFLRVPNFFKYFIIFLRVYYSPLGCNHLSTYTLQYITFTVNTPDINSIRTIFISFLFSILSLLSIHTEGQVVINELGIASTNDQGTGGEFVELFNKSGCDVDISCYVLMYSGTTYRAAGWSVTIPSGTILTPGQYYLIGGHNSNYFNPFGSATWKNGVKGITRTWKNTYGTYGNDLADLDLGTAYTSGKDIIIGNMLNNTGGQITLFNTNGSVASSLVYNSGNNSGSYPATFNPTGCTLTTSIDPITAEITYDGSDFTSYRAGLYIDASGNPQVSYNEPVNSPTPGKPNLSPIVTASAPAITTHPVSQADCKGNSVEFTAFFSATVPVTYQWQSSLDNGVTWTNISGASGYTSASPITFIAINIGVSGSNINLTQYRVIITDAYGCILTSNSAVLTVNEITGITPVNTQTTICEGQSFSFTVTTSGNPPSSYQWKKDGVNLTDGTVNGVTINGAASATLIVTNASTAQTTSSTTGYQVTVVFPISTPNNNGTGATTCSVTSSLIRKVTVNPKPTPIIYHN